MQDYLHWGHVPPLLAWSVPVAYAMGAWLTPPSAPLRHAVRVAAVSVILTAALAASSWMGTPSSATLAISLDVVTVLVLGLVSFLGWVIARFSDSYVGRDEGAPRYARALLTTLAAVAVLVTTDNLWVIAGAWMVTSLALHPLLTFFDRPAALVAAHKKFLVSRMGDLCMLGATTLIHIHSGSASLGVLRETIERLASSHQALPSTLHVAAVLLSIAAILKSAQLPFHGWLIQVMEAPTPVSALLHAGVVNIGGLVLLRVATLISSAPAACLLLVTVGMTTAVVAALVNTTRVSIKASLAWSTCAQMGFMLVECGLGLWHLALLHLVAHSLYKAHAFLSSGDTVRSAALSRMSRPLPVPSVGGYVLTALVTLGTTGLGLFAAAQLLPDVVDSSALAGTFLLALALVPMLSRSQSGGTHLLPIAASHALLMVALYLGLHALSAAVLGQAYEAAPRPLLWLIAGAGFSMLIAVHSALMLRPDGVVARALHPRLFAGLHLDERFSVVAFRIWPPNRTSVRRHDPIPTVTRATQLKV